jgi:hypothetical protein
MHIQQEPNCNEALTCAYSRYETALGDRSELDGHFLLLTYSDKRIILSK